MANSFDYLFKEENTATPSASFDHLFKEEEDEPTSPVSFDYLFKPGVAEPTPVVEPQRQGIPSIVMEKLKSFQQSAVESARNPQPIVPPEKQQEFEDIQIPGAVREAMKLRGVQQAGKAVGIVAEEAKQIPGIIKGAVQNVALEAIGEGQFTKSIQKYGAASVDFVRDLIRRKSAGEQGPTEPTITAPQPGTRQPTQREAMKQAEIVSKRGREDVPIGERIVEDWAPFISPFTLGEKVLLENALKASSGEITPEQAGANISGALLGYKIIGQGAKAVGKVAGNVEFVKKINVDKDLLQRVTTGKSTHADLKLFNELTNNMSKGEFVNAVKKGYVEVPAKSAPDAIYSIFKGQGRVRVKPVPQAPVAAPAPSAPVERQPTATLPPAVQDALAKQKPVVAPSVVAKEVPSALPVAVQEALAKQKPFFESGSKVIEASELPFSVPPRGSTQVAIAYGEKATPAQIKELRKTRETLSARAIELKEQARTTGGNVRQEAADVSNKVQFAREAIEAHEARLPRAERNVELPFNIRGAKGVTKAKEFAKVATREEVESVVASVENIDAKISLLKKEESSAEFPSIKRMQQIADLKASKRLASTVEASFKNRPEGVAAGDMTTARNVLKQSGLKILMSPEVKEKFRDVPGKQFLVTTKRGEKVVGYDELPELFRGHMPTASPDEIVDAIVSNQLIIKPEVAIERKARESFQGEMMANRATVEGLVKGVEGRIKAITDPARRSILTSAKNRATELVESGEPITREEIKQIEEIIDLESQIALEQDPVFRHTSKLHAAALSQGDIVGAERLKILENELRRTMEFMPEAGALFKKKTLLEGDVYDPEVRAKFQKQMEAVVEKLGKKLAKKTKNIKSIVRRTTGQTPIKNIIEVDESKALTDQIKLEVKAANLGFKAGKEFQKIVTSERNKAKATATKAVAGLKKAISDGKKKLARPEFREPFEDLIANLDVTKPSKRMVRRLDSLKQFVENNPDNMVPQNKLNQLDRLNKTSIRDLSIDEINSLTETITSIVHQQTLKDTLIIKGKRVAFKGKQEAAIANLSKAKSIKLDPSSISTKDETRMYNVGQLFFGIKSENPELITQRMDAGTDGDVIQDIIYGGIDRGRTRELEMRFEAEDYFKKELNGIDISRWSKAFAPNKGWEKEVDLQRIKLPSLRTIEMTKGERVGFILHSLNENNTRHVVGEGISFDGANKNAIITKISEDDLFAIVESATAEELKVASVIHKYFNEIQKGNLNVVSLRMMGIEVASEPNYFPVRTNSIDIYRDELTKKYNPSSINGFTQQTIESQGFLKKRVGASNAIIIEDAFTATLRSILGASAYVGLAEPLRNAKMLLNDKEFLIKTANTFGMDYINTLKKWLKEVEVTSANPGSMLDKLIVRAVNRAAVGFLGLNPFVMVKQPISITLAMAEIPSKYWKYAKKAGDENVIAKNSAQMRARFDGFISRELGEVSEVGSAARFWTGHQTNEQKIIMGGISKFDKEAIKHIWPMVEAWAKDTTGLSGDALIPETVALLEKIVRRTQPTFDIKDRSELATSTDSLSRTYTMFTSQLNKNNMFLKRATLEYNASKKTSADKKKFAKRVVMGYLIAQLLNWGIDEARSFLTRDPRRKRKPRPSYAIALDAVSRLLAPIYVVGPISRSLSSKIERGTRAGFDVDSPFLQGLNDLIEGPALFSEGVLQLMKKERYTSGSKKYEEKYKSTMINAIKVMWRGSRPFGNWGVNLLNLGKLPLNIYKRLEDLYG